MKKQLILALALFVTLISFCTKERSENAAEKAVKNG